MERSEGYYWTATGLLLGHGPVMHLQPGLSAPGRPVRVLPDNDKATRVAAQGRLAGHTVADNETLMDVLVARR